MQACFNNHVSLPEFNSLISLFLRFYLFIFREREREGEREEEKTLTWERNINGLPHIELQPTNDQTCNPGMYSYQESNQWPFALWDNTQHRSGPVWHPLLTLSSSPALRFKSWEGKASRKMKTCTGNLGRYWKHKTVISGTFMTSWV